MRATKYYFDNIIERPLVSIYEKRPWTGCAELDVTMICNRATGRWLDAFGWTLLWTPMSSGVPVINPKYKKDGRYSLV